MVFILEIRTDKSMPASQTILLLPNTELLGVLAVFIWVDDGFSKYLILKLKSGENCLLFAQFGLSSTAGWPIILRIGKVAVRPVDRRRLRDRLVGRNECGQENCSGGKN
jgi:hypothetical protein